jgi:serine/threonine-protein kinase
MWAAFTAGLVWTLYVALEPYVRRRWPQSMITWSRLLGGGFRDPLVGGHMLAGIALGIASALVQRLLTLSLEHYGSFGFFGNSTSTLNSVLDSRRMTGTMLSQLIVGIVAVLVLVLMFFVFRVLLHRQWLAASAFTLLAVGLGVLQSSGHPVIHAFSGVLSASLFLACVLYFGVLPLVAFGFISGMLIDSPLTTDLSAWYAGTTVFAVAVVLALTAYAFQTAVAGRPLFKAGFLESD